MKVGGEIAFGGFTAKFPPWPQLGMAQPIIEGRGALFADTKWCKKGARWELNNLDPSLDIGFRGQLSGGARWNIVNTPEWIDKFANHGVKAFFEVGVFGSMRWSFVKNEREYGGGVYARAVLELIQFQEGNREHVDRHQILGSWGVGDFIQ